MYNQDGFRIMAVDWGSKRIGLAISDPTRTIAKPLTMLEHQSRAEDALEIVNTALEEQVSLILVGITYDDENNPTPSGRSALRLADEIRAISEFEVKVWSEEGSTLEAKKSRILMGLPKQKRKGHFDEIAATIFLQKYLDENP